VFQKEAERGEGGREEGKRRAYLKEHGTREVAKLKEVDINVHVVGQLSPTLLLLSLGILISVMEGARDALGLEGGREGGREGIRAGREGGQAVDAA